MSIEADREGRLVSKEEEEEGEEVEKREGEMRRLIEDTEMRY